MKMKSSQNKQRINWLLFLVLLFAIIGIILIIIFTCVFSYTLANRINSDNESVSISMLLSTGLSIIGIAIAVWAALNITNAISRGDIERLNNTVKYLNKSVRYMKPYIDNNRYIQSELFFVELSRYEKDPIINYLSGFLQEYKDRFIQIPFSDLTKVELKFSQVRNRHQSAYHYDPILIAYGQEGISLIEDIMNNQQKPIACVQNYLLYRQCEFLFFMGYCEENLIKGAKHFEEAAVKYIEISKSLGVQFPQKNSGGTLILDKETKYRTAYLANTVGEAYSKIIHYCIENKDVIEEYKNEKMAYADMAVTYCTFSVHLLEPEQRTSTFYRNLGCALERCDNILEGFTNYKETLNAYRNAYSLIVNDYTSSSVSVRNAYFTLLSYYGKIIEYILTDKSTWKLLNISDEFSRCSGNKDELIEYVCDMFYVAKIAMEDLSHSLEMLIFYKLACCFCLVTLDNDFNFAGELSNVKETYFIREIDNITYKYQVLGKDKTFDRTMKGFIDTANAVERYYSLKLERAEYEE